MRCFLTGAAGFLVAGLIAAVAISSYGDYAARASLSETIVATHPLRERIAEALLVKEPRSIAAPREPIAGISYLKVMPDGTIVFRSAKHGQLIIFEPEVREKTVTWKCRGAPARDVPPNCR